MMPIRATQQPSLPNGNTYNVQSRAAESSRADDSGSGTEGPARKKFQRSNSNADPSTRRTNTSISSIKGVEPKSNFPSNRRTSIRDQRAPLGPRPQEPSSRSLRSISGSSGPAGPAPSLASHSRIAKPEDTSLNSYSSDNSGTDPARNDLPFEFEPAINFDDLHTNLSSDEIQLNQFPAPGNSTNTSSFQPSASLKAARLANEAAANSKSAVVSGGAGGPRFGSSGSLLRRQSLAAKQTNDSNSAEVMSGTIDSSVALPVRARRQSHFPPTAMSNSSFSSRPPRKSIGPGVIDTELSHKNFQRRRPSATMNGASASASASDLDRAFQKPTATRNVSNDNADKRLTALAAPRSLKTKSLQPAPRHEDPNLLSTPTMTPEHARSSSISQSRSPGRTPGKRTNTPSSSSSKRASTMPPHALTGLGARTVSPTDARRLKRLSTMQNPPPMPNTPPTPQPDSSGSRSTNQSPSLIPRRCATPNSTRASPDFVVKSFNPATSTSSNSSLGSSRNSTASLAPRLPQSASTSRLPTPKARNVHSSAGPEESEDVPPVPAIPKAYESPKDVVPQNFLTTGGRGLGIDTHSFTPGSTDEIEHSSLRRLDSLSVDPDTRSRRGLTIATSLDAERTVKRPNVITSKNLQPLRLPPINLLPLSTPTVSKVAALQAFTAADAEGKRTPPLKRNGKTPVTPMTASRTTFFSKSTEESDSDVTNYLVRSNSTSHGFQAGFAMHRAPSNASSNIAIPHSSDRHLPSPYTSSSLPKANGDVVDMRPNTSSDLIASSTAIEPHSIRSNGVRTQISGKGAKDDQLQRSSSPSEPEAPSSGSSLRRKLSISWKRSSSKSSHMTADRDSEHQQQAQHARHDNMPPPRLPASATWNGGLNILNASPSPAAKSSSHFERRRRKSSASSLNALAASQSNGSKDGDNAARITGKESFDSTRTTPTASRSASILAPVHKMLSSKSSSGAMRVRSNESSFDRCDQIAEEEMRKFASKRRDFENAAREVDELRRRATPKEKVTPAQAVRMVNLNIFEKGEIIDYKEVYFCGTKDAKKHVGDLNAQSANFGYDDERGDYNIVSGDHLAYRYEIVDVLGKGSFGQVVRCVDHKTGGLVAVKIIRNKKRFHQQALVEVNILKKLKEWDPQNKYSMVSFTQSFYFRGHLCISTELLGINLYEFIKSNDFRGFSLNLIRRFTRQLLNSLVLLKSHRVIHCDLKPENILLAHPTHSEIKVIDFGSSCFENEKVYTYIQSRFYRSPEVILGMTYGMPIDMWSLGCILAELFTGYPIFPGENEQEQLACIMEVFGPPEKHLIEKSTRKKLFFDSLGKPRLTVSSKGRRRRPSSKTLQQALKCDDEAFLDFITRCLRWDPERRLKPDEANQHEFITGTKKPSRSRIAANAAMESASKRATPVQTPSAVRPLPEPPATAFKNGTAVRAREASNSSPSKTNPTRRQSTVASLQSAIGVKRTSTGATIQQNSSSLPRVAGRSMGSKKDIATAAAVISLVSQPSQH